MPLTTNFFSFFQKLGEETPFHLDSLLTTNEDNAIVQELMSQIDVNHLDEAGPDPFHIRDKKKTEPENLTNKELIEKYDICQNPTDFIPDEVNYTGGTNIPFLAHFIWLGSPLPTNDIRVVIKSWRITNPTLPIILWTDQLSKYDVTLNPAMQETIEWCRQNNIALISIQDIFQGNLPLEAYFLLELQRRWFGSASDILRLCILLRFGGTYSDIDVSCKRLLKNYSKTGLRVNGEERCVDGEDVQGGEPNNDLLQAIPNHSDLQSIIDIIRENYKGKLVSLFPQGFGIDTINDRKSYPYEEALALLSAKQLFFDTTIRRTGPRNLKRAEHKKGKSFEYIPTEDFKFKSAKTWVTPLISEQTFTQEEKIYAVKCILNAILFDLEDEPRIFMLNNYAQVINRYNITNILFYLLGTYYPQKLKEIQYARFLNVFPSDEALQFITDSRFFPKVKLTSKEQVQDFLMKPLQVRILQWLLKKGLYTRQEMMLGLEVTAVNHFFGLKPIRPYLFHLFDLKSNPIKDFDEFKHHFEFALECGVDPNVLWFNEGTGMSINTVSVLCESIEEPFALQALDLLLPYIDKSTINHKRGNPIYSLVHNCKDELLLCQTLEKFFARDDIDINLCVINIFRHSDYNKFIHKLYLGTFLQACKLLPLALKGWLMYQLSIPSDRDLTDYYIHKVVQKGFPNALRLLLAHHADPYKTRLDPYVPAVYQAPPENAFDVARSEIKNIEKDLEKKPQDRDLTQKLSNYQQCLDILESFEATHTKSFQLVYR